MKDCCGTAGEVGTAVLESNHAKTKVVCPSCGSEGRGVGRQTVLHHVRHEHLGRVTDEPYHFCADPDCPTVYYGDGSRFTTNELREIVTAKANGDERPICYCFDFTEGDAREEIERTGGSTIPARISALVKAGMCACEVRHPAGVCCLGQVNQTVKRLSEEHRATTDSELVTTEDCCARC